MVKLSKKSCPPKTAANFAPTYCRGGVSAAGSLRGRLRHISQKCSLIHKVLPALFVSSDDCARRRVQRAPPKAGSKPVGKICSCFGIRFVFRQFVVGVRGLEPRASCSQSRRATNCATPRCGKPRQAGPAGWTVQRNGFCTPYYTPKPARRQILPEWGADGAPVLCAAGMPGCGPAGVSR